MSISTHVQAQEINGHRFEPQGHRMICSRCGLINHRGSGEETPCAGPRLLEGRFQMGNSTVEDKSEPQETEEVLTAREILADNYQRAVALYDDRVKHGLTEELVGLLAEMRLTANLLYEIEFNSPRDAEIVAAAARRAATDFAKGF